MGSVDGLQKKIVKKIFVFSLVLFFSSCSKFTVEKITPKNVNADVQVFSISGKLNAFHYVPNEIRHKGIVITLGGSEGSAGEWYAAPLTNLGYEVLAVYYFGKGNLPKLLSEVPLEFFDEVLNYIEKNCKGKKPITLIGGSKGAELAALLTMYYPQIDNIVLYAPAHVVFQGLDHTSSKSSWTIKKQAVPFVPLLQNAYSKIKYEDNAMVLRLMYETAVETAPEEILKKASIDLSNFQGKALIFAGGCDGLWQSDKAAEILHKQKPEHIELHIFEKAGHSFGSPSAGNPAVIGGIKNGGSLEENKKAAIESSKLLLDFLAALH